MPDTTHVIQVMLCAAKNARARARNAIMVVAFASGRASVYARGEHPSTAECR